MHQGVYKTMKKTYPKKGDSELLKRLALVNQDIYRILWITTPFSKRGPSVLLFLILYNKSDSEKCVPLTDIYSSYWESRYR